MLTPQKQLGRNFEIDVVNTLIAAGVDHHRIQHNPFDDEGYASSIKSGPDVIIDGYYPIECKFTNYSIPPSYVDRDWLPRLEGYGGLGVFACNDPEKISPNSRALISHYGYKSKSLVTIVTHLISLGLLTPSITSSITYDSNVIDVVDVNYDVFNGGGDVDGETAGMRRCFSEMTAQMVEILRDVEQLTRRNLWLRRLNSGEEKMITLGEGG